MSDQLEVRVARIESDVEHIKNHTADISVELRRTNDRIDGTNKRIDEARDSLTAKIDGVRDSLTAKIDTVRDSLTAKIEAVDKRIDDLRSELVKRIDDVHKELTEKYDSLKDLIHSSRVWALLLYITLAGGLLTLIARAFKWI